MDFLLTNTTSYMLIFVVLSVNLYFLFIFVLNKKHFDLPLTQNVVHVYPLPPPPPVYKPTVHELSKKCLRIYINLAYNRSLTVLASFLVCI